MTYDILKARLRGTVITVFDPGHAEACDALVWNGRKPVRQAKVIVRAADAGDVQEAVRYAAEHGMTVSARGGGHQFTGIAARADMVIDLAALDSLRIDVADRSALVGPAVTNTRLAAALERHDLGFPVGHCGDVTVSGYLLSGGVGWNSGSWGIACHSILSVEVVMADGTLLTASTGENPDVFWAVRGAGPSFFGIVTAYTLRLHEAPRAPASCVRIHSAAQAEAVADWAERAVARAPATLEFTAKIGAGPQGPVIAAIANVFAASETEARQVLDDLFRDAPEALDVIGPMPTPIVALYQMTGDSTPKGARYGVDCLWSDGSFGEALGKAVAAIAAAPSAQSFGLVALRSNALPIPQDAAFSHAGRVFTTFYGIWTDEEEDVVNRDWLRTSVQGCRAFATGRYVGEAELDQGGLALPTLSEAAQHRIEALQQRYDPAGLFNIVRAGADRSAA
ncbi:FAD-binding oxidoreductase [Salipiger mangrovisoli]|uniref:FAD-binding oxidoreductase n=1 Tax=Salipiger mangrovisoli TaxID=2865933 RepID=A0ABR9XB79_9RHOB|nr:FAD-binding oxidoreductase [Salipiger mangrovisoli]MBE9640752.1 FAD-binding oxidoreductase [Salipiger mangrovisoli]